MQTNLSSLLQMNTIFSSTHSSSTMVWWNGLSRCLSWWLGVSWWWVILKSSIFHLCAIQCHAVGAPTHSMLWFPSWEGQALALRDLLCRVLRVGRLGSLGCAQQHIAAKKTSRKWFPVPKCCFKAFNRGVLRWQVALKAFFTIIWE